MSLSKPRASIILGSHSDLEYGEKVVERLKSLGIESRIRIASAHRAPDFLREVIREEEETGSEVFVCIAGFSAHLPGVVASLTMKPVIGLPLDRGVMGLDSLFSMVQMPPGVPVAVVGINNTENAAILCARILSVKHPEVLNKLESFRDEMVRSVVEKDSRVREDG